METMKEYVKNWDAMEADTRNVVDALERLQRFALKRGHSEELRILRTFIPGDGMERLIKAFKAIHGVANENAAAGFWLGVITGTQKDGE